MKPEHLITIILLAKLALENLLLVSIEGERERGRVIPIELYLKIDEAIDWSKKVLEINENNLKGNIIFGCSLIKKAYLEKQRGNKIKYLNEALESFKK